MILKKPAPRGGLTWSLFKGGSKYNAQKTEYNGVLYHSRLEARYAQYLDTLKKAGKIKSWKGQVRIPLTINGAKICVYVVDFQVEHVNGSLELVETKGYWTDVAKLKLKLFQATFLRENPQVKYTIVSKDTGM